MNWLLTHESIDIRHLQDVFVGYGAFDINEKKDWLAVIKKENSEELFLVYKDLKIALPPACESPIARFLNDGAIIVNCYIDKQDEVNAWIINLNNGKIIHEFSVGHDINDVVVLQDFIAVGYGDMGVFSDITPSSHGLAFFDHRGKYQYGNYDLDEPVCIVHCYAMCNAGGNELVFYANSEFDIVQLNVAARFQQKLDTPDLLHFADAITLHQNTAFLKGPYANDEALLAYDLQTRNISTLGIISGQYCRGIADARFLSYHEGYLVISSLYDTNSVLISE